MAGRASPMTWATISDSLYPLAAAHSAATGKEPYGRKEVRRNATG
jgi:hypothetical protein